jgi:hypothetical protein
MLHTIPVLLVSCLTALSCLSPVGIPPTGNLATPFQDSRFYQGQPECSELIPYYTLTEQGMNELINPVLIDLEQIDSQLQSCDRLQSCLSDLKSEVTQPQRQVDILCQLFSIFADQQELSESVTRLAPVNLRNSSDPAVEKLRSEVGLVAPPGYVFVSLYPSRQAMPEIVGSAFQDPQVAGVTILSRYVAILEQEKNTWPERMLQSITVEKTLSHELVHAFVNSYLAERDYFGQITLPKWFEEGIAIYFSGSNEPSAIITPNLTVSQAPTEEYQQYHLIFEYLRAKLGRQEFLWRIQQVLDRGDAGLLYQDLGIQDDRALLLAAQSWQVQRIQYRSLLALAGILSASFWLYSRLPQLECPCGFAGKLNDFSQDRCPRCSRPVDSTRRRHGGDQLQVAPACQVCGRRFWPWQRAHLKRHSRWVKVWVSNPTGSGAPLSRFVDAVCDRCTDRSASLYAEFHTEIMSRISQVRSAAVAGYRDWLGKAPIVWSPIGFGWQILTFQQALDLLVEAALQPAFQDWLETTGGPKLAYSSRPEDSSFIPPPASHQRVLVQADSSHGYPYEQYGTIFRTTGGQVALLWQTDFDLPSELQ